LAFWLRAERLCRFLPGPARTLPVAVILKRFLALDVVFILDIRYSHCAAGTARLYHAPTLPTEIPWPPEKQRGPHHAAGACLLGRAVQGAGAGARLIGGTRDCHKGA